MDIIKVSVIIPIYNSQRYLEQCILSVRNQSLKEIEIICVDDGSTDASLEIIHNHQIEDPRITVIKQQNQYAGVARNSGLEVAKGKYLVFWDSDDYFFSKALEKMYKQCEIDDADICICSGRQYYEDGKFEAPGSRYIRQKEIPAVIPYNMETEPDHVLSITVEAPWNKMFKRDFILRHGLQFQSYRNANDVYFVESALCLANRITIVNEELICYRKNKDNGLVASVDKGLLTCIQAWLDTADNLRANQVFPEKSFSNRCLESLLYLLNNTNCFRTFREALLFLNEENLTKLSILRDRPEDFYYIGYHKEAVEHLYNDSPEEFLIWMNHFLFLREAAVTGKMRNHQEKYDKHISKLKDEKTKLQITIENQAKTIMTQEKENKNNAKKIKALNDIKLSFSYKIGRAITWLPRKIRGVFRAVSR